MTNVPTGVIAPKWFPDSKRIAFLSQVWPDAEELGGDGAAHEGARRAEDDARRCGTRRRSATGTTSSTIARRTCTRSASTAASRRRSRSARASRWTSPSPTRSSYDIAPDGARDRVRRPTPTAAASIRTSTSSCCRSTAAPRRATSRRDNPARRHRAEVQPRRPAARVSAPDDQGLLRRPRAPDAVRPARRQDPQPDRRLGSLGRRPGVVARLGRAVRLDRRCGHAAHLSLRRRRRRAARRSRASTASARSRLPAAGRSSSALRQSFTEPPTLVSIIARTGAATKLSDFNDAALADLTQGRVESVTYKGANGDDVQMWIVYPPNFTPDRKWPLYLLLHGGPHNGVTDGYQWRWNAQVFANWGYVTAWHNFHGSSGFGQAWTDSITKDWAELPYQDTIKATEWFAAQPWIDADRMAAGGGSYGGYLAATAARQAASVQDTGRARRRVRQLHAVRERWRRDEEALRRVLGRPGALQSQLAAPERGEFQDADAGHSRPARPARAGESTASSCSTRCRTAACRASSCTSRTRITGCSSRRTRCSGTRPSASGWSSTSRPARRVDCGVRLQPDRSTRRDPMMPVGMS